MREHKTPASHGTFTDATQFAEVIRSANVSCFQSSKGPFEMGWVGGRLPSLGFELMHLKAGTCLAIASSPHQLSVHVPLSFTSELRLLGENVNPLQIVAYKESDGHSVYATPGARLAHLAPDVGLLQECCEHAHGSELSLTRITSGFIHAGSRSADRLRASLSDLETLIASSPLGLSSHDILRRFEHDIAEGMLSALGVNGHRSYARGRNPVPRALIIRRVKSFFEQTEATLPTVFDLCKAANVSQPTLYRVFQESYGVSPKRFLQLRRLHEVRRRLMSVEDGEASVSSVALDCGFWQLSRFRSAYRQLFGETPSVTLKQARG